MIRSRPACVPKVVAVLWLLSSAPGAYAQQADPSLPDDGRGPSAAAEIKLCVPADIVERDLFERPEPGSRMAAFHSALRDFLRDHGDVHREYLLKPNAFVSYDPASTDLRSLMDEAGTDAGCRATDYSYNLPVTRVARNAAQEASQSAVQGTSASDSLNRGWQYQVGKGVPKDPAMAARLYADAANQGLPEAMYRLALLYSDGNGVRQDAAAAVDCFYRAAKQGHAAAQMELGFALITGNGVRRDDVAGFRWLLLAAEAGLPRAQGGVGAMYETGTGVTQNESEAAVWFRRAAEQGQVIGMFELGQSLRMGRGVTRNAVESMQWYQKSAEAGYVPAQGQLGFGYLTGTGAVQDYHLAAHWLTEAARQGDPYAQINLGTMYEDGSGVERNIAQARALYAQAARSQVPQVAEHARQLAAALSDSSGELPPGNPAPSSNTNAVIGVAAAVIAGAVLISFLSRSGSDDPAASPPNIGSSPVGGPYGSDNSLSSARPTPPPPAPHCHSAPIEDPFTIRPGVYTPHGGSTLVCDN